MKTQLITLLISIVSFNLYLIIIEKIYGVQKSISMSVKCLPDKWKWLFVLFMIMSMAPLLITTIDKTLMPIAIWMVLAVGATPLTERDRFAKLSEGLHMFGAFGGISLGFVSLWIEYGMWYLVLNELVLVLILFLTKSIRGEVIWYIELFSYIILVLGILISIFV